MIRFDCDGTPVALSSPPHVTLLEWLRASGRTATKEGCAEGDCGACSVVLVESDGRSRAVNACLVLLPQVHGQRVVTAAGLGAPDALHPAQRAMVDALGSQCGFCTPGFVASIAEACHRTDLDEPWKLDDQLCGNLCRCTGYRPIRDALAGVAGCQPDDLLSRPFTPDPARPEGWECEGEAWFSPIDLAGAFAVLRAHPGVRPVNGATDLGLEVTQRHRRFPALLDLSRISELREITPVPGGFRLGAGLPLTDVEAWSADALPVLHRTLRYFGSRQIKHRATLGGNLCTASPIGDTAPTLLALDATLILASAAGERRVPIDAWFQGYRKTALRPDELLVAVELPAPSPIARLGSYKVSRRRELDISAVSACFRVEVTDGVVSLARFAFGGMAATPTRAHEAERAVLGRPWTEEAAEEAALAVEGSLAPLTDHRGSSAYRSAVAANLVRGFFAETAEQPFVPLRADHVATVDPR